MVIIMTMFKLKHINIIMKWPSSCMIMCQINHLSNVFKSTSDGGRLLNIKHYKSTFVTKNVMYRYCLWLINSWGPLFTIKAFRKKYLYGFVRIFFLVFFRHDFSISSKLGRKVPWAKIPRCFFPAFWPPPHYPVGLQFGQISVVSAQ